jgi:hypothetical protein
MSSFHAHLTISEAVSGRPSWGASAEYFVMSFKSKKPESLMKRNTPACQCTRHNSTHLLRNCQLQQETMHGTHMRGTSITLSAIKCVTLSTSNFSFGFLVAKQCLYKVVVTVNQRDIHFPVRRLVTHSMMYDARSLRSF